MLGLRIVIGQNSHNRSGLDMMVKLITIQVNLYCLIYLNCGLTYFLEWDRTGQFRKILHNYFTGRDKIFRVYLAMNYLILPVLALYISS